MAKLPLKLGPGQVLTAFKAEVLRHLGDAGAAGICPGPVTPGGTLAQLRAFGLAERMPQPANDSLGGVRTRITEPGLAVLKRLGMV